MYGPQFTWPISLVTTQTALCDSWHCIACQYSRCPIGVSSYPSSFPSCCLLLHFCTCGLQFCCYVLFRMLLPLHFWHYVVEDIRTFYSIHQLDRSISSPTGDCVVNPFLCMWKQFCPIFVVTMTVNAAEFWQFSRAPLTWAGLRMSWV